MNWETIFWIYYVLSVGYCMWRLFKRYQKSSLDGVIGVTPGLDLIVVIVLGPLLAIVDIIATWIIRANSYYKEKQDKIL
jgi:hypothetical protein